MTELWIYGAKASGTGPTIREGHIIDWSFSRWRVKRRPEGPECTESRDEYDEAMLWTIFPGDTAREAVFEVRWVRKGKPRSSADEREGDDSAGDDAVKSSASDASSDAAKLLDISGSETSAKEDCVDAVDAVDVVRPRVDSRDDWGSSCHTEFVTSTLPYRRP